LMVANDEMEMFSIATLIAGVLFKQFLIHIIV